MHDSYWVVPEEDSDIVHYGVKGMKWGVRKSEYKSMSRKDRRKLRKRKNEGYSDHQRELDKIRLGGKSVKRINKRMNKGATYKQAIRREYVRRFTTSFAAANVAQFLRSNPQIVLAGTALAVGLGSMAVTKLTKLQLTPAARKWHNFTEATAKNRLESAGFNGPNVINVTPISVTERRRRF